MNARVGVFVALAAALMLSALAGRVAAAQAPPKPPRPSEAEKTVKLVLHPAPEPRPALKYQLLPPFPDRRPGNAAVWWNRLPAEQNRYFSDLYKEGGVWEKVEKWMEVPVGDPKEKELRAKARGFENERLFADMARAARFETCDWQLPIREGGFMTLLLPEMQQARSYGRLLSAKARLEIAEGKYDQAVRTLQTGFALSRHVASGPTLIHALVGTAIAGLMCARVEEFVQQPDAPNFYWALSALPRPLVDFRPGFEAEQHALYLTFPDLQDLDKRNLSPDGWRELLMKTAASLRGLVGGRAGPDDSAAVAAALALQGYPRAKRYLIERGRSAAEVEAMPVAQVILLYTVRLYDELRDEQFKWLFLPYTEACTGLERADRSLKQAVAAQREIIPFAAMLLPAVGAAKNAEARMQWNLALLRIFEAMRLYAAAHDGRWPDRLGDIADVPIPVNPYDNKPFGYQREGDRAVLTSELGPPGVAWRYEITLSQK